jgi:inactivated superfamily I helicase/RecB family exonuclease
MMFPPSDRPRVIGVPPGTDFLRTLFERLTGQFDTRPPEELARVLILVANNRMQRRLAAMFHADGRPRLLPRIHVVTDVAPLVPGADLPAAASSLRRGLELKALVERLVALDPRLSPASVVDLSESLAQLLDEMESEGVPLDALDGIDADSSTGHWQRSLAFLQTIRAYAEALGEGTVDASAAGRMAVEELCAAWDASPPDTAVIVAGSTGSRAATRMLMTSASRLPQGAVVLPGFDADLPENLWAELDAEDHPQYRLAAFLKSAGVDRSEVIAWGAPPRPDRNRLISLSLRPPSVTDQWRADGPLLGDLPALSADLALIEAPETRDESLAIAAAIRDGIEAGLSVALIAPDATLARRVSAALDRWGIRADDSGARPLSLSPAGRFVRQVSGLIGAPADPVDLFALLKHPMTRAGEDRGPHKLATQHFESFVRERRVLEVGPSLLDRFAELHPERNPWTDWLRALLAEAAVRPEPTLADALDRHLSLVQGFSGSDAAVFDGEDGEAVRSVLDGFAFEADFPGSLPFEQYRRFLDAALAGEKNRAGEGVRTDVMIWGGIESRAQGAELVILGGLNEGTWPREPVPDPWLNRRMRHEIGLFLPERRIGLAAHDYQQAMGAPKVVLSRARRADGTETVPSRWLNRLTNLMNGLPSGEEALREMRARGEVYLASARALDTPAVQIDPERRPAPAPPVDLRPRSFAVTRIKELIRDPYAIYARRILDLKPMEPLRPEPDARLRGTVIHRILETVFSVGVDLSDPDALERRLRDVATEVLEAEVPWPAIRAEWLTDTMRNARWLIGSEEARLRMATPLKREVKGRYAVPGTVFEITGEADRIDRLSGGGLVIYDYKTGSVPRPKDILRWDRQLPIEAVMAEAGAFEGVPAETVARVVHLSVNRSPKEQVTRLEGGNETVTVQRELARLLTGYLDPATGYLSRRMMERERYGGDYDHLARYGEWSEADDAVTVVLP